MPITSIEKFGIINRDKDYTNLNSIPSPSWAKSAIIYEVYFRSFSKDGNISAFTRKLPELKELGIDVIWLMPIHSIGHLKRKGPLGSPYAIRDFYRVNPEYGKKSDFKELVTESHKLGIRLILDFVANHAANDHIEIKNHPDWFIQDKNGKFTRQIPGWSDVIDLNYNNKDLREYIKKIALYWANEFDIDGFRCDVAGMVPENFWIDVRHELLKLKSEFLLLAEWEDPEMHLNSFDVTYDWILYYKLYDIFSGLAPAKDAIDLLIRRQKEFPKNALRLRFLENHDQARATYKFGLSSFKPFATFIFTIDGLPLIYNGQEVGDPKHLTLFDKNSINWKMKGAHEIRKFYKSLIEVRKSSPVFTEGETIKIDNNKPKQVISFCRKIDRQTAIIVLNLSDKDCSVTLKNEINYPAWQFFDINTLNNEKVTVEKWHLQLKPYDGQIFLSE